LHLDSCVTKERKTLKYYPVFWNITGKKCVVVGGGEVAERKVKRLLECGAKVFVISSRLTPELARLNEKNMISHVAKEYSVEQIYGAALVIGATDDEKTNTAIASDARNKGILVNIVDDPQKCDFILPSLVERGDLTIAISTGGKSPALARYLREEFETAYGEEYRILLDILGSLRAKMTKKTKVGQAWFNSLIAADILDIIRQKKWRKVKEIIKKKTGEEVEIELD
jgi:precorrin-2 dehydrogenase/sirohydrochlorin ferrochelatase